MLVDSVSGPTQAVAASQDWGHTGAPDRVLKGGCNNYSYRYRVNPPPGDWGLETQLVDPTGDELASGTFLSGQNPKMGRGTSRICRPNTQHGRFKIKSKLTVIYGTERLEGMLERSYFRLRKAF